MPGAARSGKNPPTESSKNPPILQEASSSNTCQERTDLQTHGFQTSSLRNCERLSFCGFRLPSLRRLSQQCQGTGETVQPCFHLTGMDSNRLNPLIGHYALPTSGPWAGTGRKPLPPTRGPVWDWSTLCPQKAHPGKWLNTEPRGFSSFLMATPTQSLPGGRGLAVCLQSYTGYKLPNTLKL